MKNPFDNTIVTISIFAVSTAVLWPMVSGGIAVMISWL